MGRHRFSYYNSKQSKTGLFYQHSYSVHHIESKMKLVTYWFLFIFRRSRRSDQERTPTNISSPWVQATYLNETVDERFHHTPDSDTESALAALDNALNFNFHTPVVERNSDKRHSVGPVPIIREYIGETEEDWLKQQRRYESTSPEVFSVIEIDESSEDEDRRRAVALPLDDLESKLLSPVHALHIDSPTLDSGSFSLRTPPEDSCYMSDIDA